MQAHTAKLFGIGLSKTGTTSLARALQILGYRTKDYLGVDSYAAGDLSSINLEEIDAHDAFTDTPIPSFYKELDAQYPGSKFILTTRDMDEWLRSCQKQFTKRIVSRHNEATRELHTDLYGCFEFDAEKYANGYTRFVNGVLDYFKERPQDLLVIDICGGETWEKLCGFLGKPLPDIPFPVSNVSAIQWMDIQKVVSIARAAGQAINTTFPRETRNPSSDSRGNLLSLIRSGFTRLFTRTETFSQQDSHDRVKNAAELSLKIVLDGLKELNPSIPAITPANADTPFEERRNWGYLWLVDPLAGAEPFRHHQDTFTVNIALIEGGRPIWGVVYNPIQDIVYYAKGASGGYKIAGAKSPQKLTPADMADKQPSVIALTTEHDVPDYVKERIERSYEEYKLLFTGSSMALCLLAEGKAAMHIRVGSGMEWETAAAHAVAASSGKRVYDYKTGKALVYNKEHLVHESFIAE